MIDYIFSDKTGTLTKNIMEFKKFSAGLKSYGGASRHDDRDIICEEGVNNVNFNDDEFYADWLNTKSENYYYLS